MKKILWTPDKASLCVFSTLFLNQKWKGDLYVEKEHEDVFITEKCIIKKAIETLGDKYASGGVFVARKNKILEIEKAPHIVFRLLDDFICEEQYDGVEFRRLVRKYIRKAKQYNWKKIYCLDISFLQKDAKKIIQQIAGTQIEVVTLDEILGLDFFDYNIATAENKDFVVEFLQKYLGDNNIEIKKGD